MKAMRKYIAILLVGILIISALTGCSNADQTSPTNGKVDSSAKSGFVNVQGNEDNIDEQNIISIIKELISDKYAGRLTGTEGNQMAAEYIAGYFKELGLESPKGIEDYLCYYNQPVHNFTSEPILNVVSKDGNVVKELENGDNFAIRIIDVVTGSVDITAPIYNMTDSNALKDTTVDLKDKMIFINSNASEKISTRDVLQIASSRDAKGIIIETDVISSTRRSSELVMVPLRDSGYRGSIPMIYVDNDGAKAIQQAAEEAGSIRFKCEYKSEWNKSVPNVIGMIPGSDPVLKDEYIIVGGHFDHVGDNMNGTYNPGALDNASGTAVMMEVARLMKQNKLQPKKTILFIGFNGEEIGLIGSREYASDPIYPLDKAVLINLDMVGASAKMPLSIMISDEKSSEMSNEFMNYAKKLGIDARPGSGGGSDHASFSSYGVPAVLLIHEDFLNGYHSFADTIEDVSAERLEEVVKLVMYYLDKKAF